MEIYLVWGDTGEYEDAREWVVKAFKKKEDAQALVDFLNKKCKELECSTNNYKQLYSFEEEEGRDQKMKVFDPHFSCDYTGTHYSLGVCEYVEEWKHAFGHL